MQQRHDKPLQLPEARDVEMVVDDEPPAIARAPQRPHAVRVGVVQLDEVGLQAPDPGDINGQMGVLATVPRLPQRMMLTPWTVVRTVQG